MVVGNSIIEKEKSECAASESLRMEGEIIDRQRQQVEMKTLLSHQGFNETSLSCTSVRHVNLAHSDSINSDRQNSTFPRPKSIPIPLTTLASLLHTHKSHLRVKNTTITPCKGIYDSGNTIFNYPLVVAEDISSGIVSVTVTVLSHEAGQLIIGLIDSSHPNSELGTGLGCDSKWFEIEHRETCHPPLKEGDCVRMEVDMDSKPRTLQFFVNGEAGQFYVSDLPTLVRVTFMTFFEGTSVRVDRIVRQSKATPIKPGTSRLDWEEINSRMPTCNSVTNCPRHFNYDW
ncbi:hypothetical protein BLNAU_18214 [Blattamonas nauphoetae]|uniref:SPRY domain-containing protein n=1 Tax=Blattamonas nauphoetae TaxID=2049346 RepID=A0ABQ9X4Y4_9EUKA|nr:hypothetical protein BLNAU_18214 [Blattamonas nauphoetae]